jgi:anti-sigma factor RsiW
MSGIDIPCAQIVEMVTQYLEDALDPQQRQLFEEHLADCPPCHRYVEQIQVTLAQLGAVREPDLPPEAWEALRAAFRGTT